MNIIMSTFPNSLTGSTSSLAEAQTEPQEFTMGTIKLEPSNVTSTVVKSEPPDGASNTGSDSGFSSFLTTTSEGSTEDLSVKDEMYFPPPEGDVPFMHHVLHLRGMGPRFHGFRGWPHHFRGLRCRNNGAVQE